MPLLYNNEGDARPVIRLQGYTSFPFSQKNFYLNIFWLILKRIYISKFALFYDLFFFATWLQEARFEVQKQIDPLKHHHGTSQSLNIDVITKMAPSYTLSHFYIILFVIKYSYFDLQQLTKKKEEMLKADQVFILNKYYSKKRGAGECLILMNKSDLWGLNPVLT